MSNDLKVWFDTHVYFDAADTAYIGDLYSSYQKECYELRVVPLRRKAFSRRLKLDLGEALKEQKVRFSRDPYPYVQGLALKK